jgi:hypothetical protein
MADTALTDYKGRLAFDVDAAYGNEDLIVVPLSAKDTDGVFEDGYADFFLDTVLAGGAVERTTGGWSRQVHTNANITGPTADDTNDLVRVILDVDDTWAAVTGGNDVVALLICVDAATDALRRVIGQWDFAVTTDGNDVTANYDQTNGIWTAA